MPYQIGHQESSPINDRSGDTPYILRYIQWNLSVTTTSMIKFITCDLFSNAF